MTAIDTARRAVEVARALPAPLRRTMLTAITSGDGSLHLLDCPPSVLNDLGTHGLVECEPAPLTDLGRMVYTVLMDGAETVMAAAEAGDRGDTPRLPGAQLSTSVSATQGEGDSPHTLDVAVGPDRNAESSSSNGGSLAVGDATVEALAAVEDMVHRGVQALRTRVTEQLGDVSLDWYDTTVATLRAALAAPTVNDTGTATGDDRHGLRKSR